MASRWVNTTLGDVLTLQRGFDLPEVERSPGPYPVIASNGPVGTHSKAMVEGPGVVIGRSGSLGGGQYIIDDFWPLNTTLWVKDFKGNDRRFCYYLLKSLDLAHFNAGSGVPTLNRNHIHPLPIFVPEDPVEQYAIGHILGALDDKIELNRQINQTLEAMARALFKSWFVDFDPVRAKAEGRDTGLSQTLDRLFPSEFESSDLGDIPRGWSVQSLREIAQVFSGGTPSKSNAEYWNGSLPWISPKAMNAIHVDHSDETVTPVAVGNGTRLVHKGSVLVMVRGMGLHQGVRISQAQCDVTFNQDVKALVPNWGDGSFLLFALLDASSYLFSKVQSAGHGTGVLPTDALESLSFAVPPIQVRGTLLERLENWNSKIAANIRATETLIAIRDTLLPKLILGELRVPSTDRFNAAMTDG
jgi:type I restriction enzyme S subunit